MWYNISFFEKFWDYTSPGCYNCTTEKEVGVTTQLRVLGAAEPDGYPRAPPELFPGTTQKMPQNWAFQAVSAEGPFFLSSTPSYISFSFLFSITFPLLFLRYRVRGFCFKKWCSLCEYSTTSSQHQDRPCLLNPVPSLNIVFLCLAPATNSISYKCTELCKLQFLRYKLVMLLNTLNS